MKKAKKIIVFLLVIFAVYAYTCNSAESYKVGDKVQVIWKKKLYDATIVTVEKDNMYTIHYEGWDDNRDEVVGVDRIELIK